MTGGQAAGGYDACGVAAALPLLERTRDRLGRPVLVGIGGPGGSGKSTFARSLAEALGEAVVLPLDDYRKPRDERRWGIYGSHPEGNRLGLLTSHLEAVRAGRSIERPVFCRELGSAAETQRVDPRWFVIADGEVAAHRTLRGHFDVRILVMAGWKHQWQARMGRDRVERSTSIAKALSLFVCSNLCDFPRFAAGASAEADLVLKRTSCGQHLRCVRS